MLWTYIDQKFFGGSSMKLKLEQQEEKHNRHKTPDITKPAKFE
jgi:hypothetical protein